jgi:hypothetical protein
LEFLKLFFNEITVLGVQCIILPERQPHGAQDTTRQYLPPHQELWAGPGEQPDYTVLWTGREW